MARYFRAATTSDYRGPYALAVRHLSVRVRSHLTYGFFTWQRVRSYLPERGEADTAGA